MAKLIYSSITSLDGYIEDEKGNFDWAAQDQEAQRRDSPPLPHRGMTR
jgi:hypothetical protein